MDKEELVQRKQVWDQMQVMPREMWLPAIKMLVATMQIRKVGLNLSTRARNTITREAARSQEPGLVQMATQMLAELEAQFGADESDSHI